MLLYINELVPSARELVKLKKEIINKQADVLPERGSHDESLLNMWQQGNTIPDFSLNYRLARAIRVIPVTLRSSEEAANALMKLLWILRDVLIKKLQLEIF